MMRQIRTPRVEITKEDHGYSLWVCFDEYLEVPLENADEMRQVAKVLFERADEIDEVNQIREANDETA